MLRVAAFAVLASAGSTAWAAMPAPEAVEKALMLGCGIRMLHPTGAFEGDDVVKPEPAPPAWLVRQGEINPSFGKPSFFRVAADGGDVFVTTFDKAPLCTVVARLANSRSTIQRIDEHLRGSKVWQEDTAAAEVRGETRMRVFAWQAAPAVRFGLIFSSPTNPDAPDQLTMLTWAPMNPGN